MTAFSPAELHALMRADFYSFLVRSFAELHAGQTFSPAWHAEVLAAKLQGVGEGHVRRLVVNVPPRHLKCSPLRSPCRPGCSATILRSPSSTSLTPRTCRKN